MNSKSNELLSDSQSFEYAFEKIFTSEPKAQENNNSSFIPLTSFEPQIKINFIYNIEKKIYSHFIEFSINFCNDVLEEENLDVPHHLRYFKFEFPDIDNIFYSNQNLKKTTIKELLISKRRGIDYNKKLIEKIESYSPWFFNLFQMNLLKLFKYYYNDEKPLNKINFENKEIYLSPGTITFYDLLENNKYYRYEIIEAAKKYFLDEENNI